MTTKPSLAELAPLRPGMFRYDENGEPVGLVAGRCAGCGRVTFPARAACPNCPSGTPIDDHLLSTRGVIYAATTIHLPSALGHPAPYSYGYVELPEDDTRIFAPLLSPKGRTLCVGEAVRLAFFEIPAKALEGTLGYGFAVEDNPS